jgi:ParB/RepB/Spo0J family partition protein
VPENEPCPACGGLEYEILRVAGRAEEVVSTYRIRPEQDLPVSDAEAQLEQLGLLPPRRNGHGQPAGLVGEQLGALANTLPTAAPDEHAMIPIEQLVPSASNPRKQFDDHRITELAESMRRHGVLQDLLVRRRRDGRTGESFYEIIAGERRYHAAKQAELTHVPCKIREVPDRDILELQLIENDEREDLNPIERGEAYRQLIDQHGYTVETLAARLKKSKGTVYDTLQLVRLLDPQARKLLLEGTLPAATAGLIAEIGDEKTQTAAAKEIITVDWRGDLDVMSFRRAKELIQKKYKRSLSKATWKLDDAELDAKAGACGVCPHRIAATNVCTKPSCFNRKTELAIKRRFDEIPNAGVLTSKQTHKVFNQYHYGEGRAPLNQGWGYVDPADKCPADPKKRSWQQVLGKESPTPFVAKDPRGKVRKLFSEKEACAALQSKGYPWADKAKPSPKRELRNSWEENQTRRKKVAEKRDGLMRRLFAEIVRKADDQDLAGDLRFWRLIGLGLLSDYRYERTGALGEIARRRDLSEKNPKKSLLAIVEEGGIDDVQLLLFELAVMQGTTTGNYGKIGKLMGEACKLVGVNRRAIEKEFAKTYEPVKGKT